MNQTKRGPLFSSRNLNKRAQLTIFILIAVVIFVGIVIVIFMFKGDNQSSNNSEYWKGDAVRVKVDSVNSYLQDCIASTTKEGLVLIALQGGYYLPPTKKFDYSPIFFPYYYYDGQINFPSLARIEAELGSYVNDKMIDCVDKADFENIKLRFEDPKTITKVTNQNVYFEVDMPITLESDGNTKTIELKDSPINYNSSLYEIYEVAEYFTNTHKEDPEYYCISCLAEMASDRGLYVYLFPNIAGEKITGVMIYENRTGIADPYAYIFFNKYTGNEETPKLKI